MTEKKKLNDCSDNAQLKPLGLEILPEFFITSTKKVYFQNSTPKGSEKVCNIHEFVADKFRGNS